jgi:hypothetical protein
MLNNALNNVLKFAATAAQEAPGIFDNAPVDSMAQPASGFLETCTEWVSENKTVVIGATAAVAVGVGAYYSYPWLRGKLKGSKDAQTASNPATPEADSTGPTAEDVQSDLQESVRKANEYAAKNPRSARK